MSDHRGLSPACKCMDMFLPSGQECCIKQPVTLTVCSAGAKRGSGVPYAIWPAYNSVSFKFFKLEAR